MVQVLDVLTLQLYLVEILLKLRSVHQKSSGAGARRPKCGPATSVKHHDRFSSRCNKCSQTEQHALQTRQSGSCSETCIGVKGLVK